MILVLSYISINNNKYCFLSYPCQQCLFSVITVILTQYSLVSHVIWKFGDEKHLTIKIHQDRINLTYSLDSILLFAGHFKSFLLVHSSHEEIVTRKSSRLRRRKESESRFRSQHSESTIKFLTTVGEIFLTLRICGN